MILLISTLLLISCTTLQRNETAVVPDPFYNGEYVVRFDKDTETVSMPFWYWKKIVRYIIDTQTVKNVNKDGGNP